jgi:hypothetical protein
MDLGEIEDEMACLDVRYEPVARVPVDVSSLDAVMTMGVTIGEELARLGVDDRAEAVLRAVIRLYAGGDEATRTAVRQLFDRYGLFRWAAHLPRDWSTAGDFRARLIHLSARDQSADPRDEILTLQVLCDRAREHDIDIEPILDDVAAMSSDVDRYGMGSMRTIILTFGWRRAA